MADFICAENLCKYYGEGESRVHALRTTSVGFKQGEFTAVIGPSGSGKSTLLHLLGGLEFPSRGSVYFEGRDLYAMKDDGLSRLRRKSFGFVFQSFNLIPILSVEENILLPVLLDGAPIDREYINDIVGFLKLKDRLRHLPGAISGGQQQRVALARALANKPSVILADEPTGNLDTKSSADVLNLLAAAQEQYRLTIIMVTHDALVAEKASRVIEIMDGRIIRDSVGSVR